MHCRNCNTTILASISLFSQQTKFQRLNLENVYSPTGQNYVFPMRLCGVSYDVINVYLEYTESNGMVIKRRIGKFLKESGRGIFEILLRHCP